MSENVEVTTVAPESHATPDVVIGEDQPTQGETGKSLMGEVPPSEAELKGAEDAETKPSEEQGGEEEGKTPAEGDKPPTGHVPHAALYEERLHRQELAREVDYLHGELNALKAGQKADDLDAFKVLTDEEFDELAEDDPVEAVKYQRALRKHEEEQYSKEVKRQTDQEQYYRDQTVISQSIERMEKAVFGIHEDGNPINQELTQFAIDSGFDPDYLQAMTSPGTLILPPGAKNAVLLGDGAAGLVDLIHKFYSATKGRAPAKAHIKGSGARKIGGTITDIPEGGLTEADYAKMSSAEREKALGG